MIKEILISFLASLSNRIPQTPEIIQEIIETQTEYVQVLQELEVKQTRLEKLLVEKNELEKDIEKQQKKITEYLDKKNNPGSSSSSRQALIAYAYTNDGIAREVILESKKKAKEIC